jgi:hypothetical protein
LMAVVMKFTLAVLLVWTQMAGLYSYLCRKLQCWSYYFIGNYRKLAIW